MDSKITGTVIACDFATVTGFAIARDGEFVASGTQSIKPKRGDSAGFKWTMFTVRFRELLDEQKPALLVYELPFIAGMRSATVAEVAFGCVTRAKELCDERGIEYRGVPNSVIKQWATGSGNAKKEAVIAAAVKKWPQYDPKRDPGGDESDAAWLLDYALAGFPDLAAAKAQAVAAEKAASLAAKAKAASERAAFCRTWMLQRLHGYANQTAAFYAADAKAHGLTAAETRRALAALEAEGAVRRDARGRWRVGS